MTSPSINKVVQGQLQCWGFIVILVCGLTTVNKVQSPTEEWVGLACLKGSVVHPLPQVEWDDDIIVAVSY